MCLGSLHSEAQDFEIAFHHTGHGYRSQHYTNALTILIRLFRHDTRYEYTVVVSHCLLSWLESYPFGGFDKVQDKRSSIERLLSLNYYHEPMHVIILLACRNWWVKDELVKRGLLDERTALVCEYSENLGVEWYEASIIQPLPNHLQLQDSRDRAIARTRAMVGRIR